MQAIEAMASEMLRLRSLAVPKLRFSASQDTLRTLLSHSVLIEMQDGQLTFGHQTLLDVLVISGTERQRCEFECVHSKPAARAFFVRLVFAASSRNWPPGIDASFESNCAPF